MYIFFFTKGIFHARIRAHEKANKHTPKEKEWEIEKLHQPVMNYMLQLI